MVQHCCDSGITNKLFYKCNNTTFKISLNCQNRFLSKQMIINSIELAKVRVRNAKGVPHEKTLSVTGNRSRVYSEISRQIGDPNFTK